MLLASGGRVLIGGSFESTVAFKGVAGTAKTLISLGKSDGFLLEVDETAGNLTRAVRFGGAGSDNVYGITTLLTNTYICGTFEGTATGEALIGSASATSNGLNDGFLASLNSLGKINWVKGFGGAKSDVGRRVAPGIDNSVTVVGYFNSPSFLVGLKTLTSAGLTDALLIKYSTLGLPLWANRFGGPLDDEGRDVVVDVAGNQYVTGVFQGTAKDDLNIGRTSLGDKDVLVWKLSLLGVTTSVEQAGGSNDDQGRCITLSGTRPIVGGMYFRNAVFGKDGLPDKTECGNGGAFIGRVGPPPSPLREGVDELAPGLQLAVFPNPAQSTLTLTVTGTEANRPVRLFDTQGHQVLESVLTPGQPATLQVGALPRGLYMVHAAGQRKRVVLQ